MKQIKTLILFAIAVITAKSGFSQNSTCTSAQSLSFPLSNDTINASAPTNELWYTFTASGNFFLDLNNLSASPDVYAVDVYDGNCAGLNLLQSDSISGTASNISMTITSLAPGLDIYYLRLRTTNQTVSFKLNLSNSTNSFSFGCPAGNNPCPANPSCELLCNGTFEYTSGQVLSISELSFAFNWQPATQLGTADLFSTTGAQPAIQIPCNGSGMQNTLAVSACSVNNTYAGILNEITPSNVQYAEYLETQLTSPMVFGKKYIVSFYVSKGVNMTGTLSALAIWLTAFAINEPGNAPLTNSVYPPSAVYSNTTIINTVGQWNKISFCYQALGGEQFLTIGRPQGSTILQGVYPSTLACGFPYDGSTFYDRATYHYIDEVSVKPFDITASATATCENVSLIGSYACGNPSISLSPLTYSWTGGPGVIPVPTNITASAVIPANATFSLTVTGNDSNNQSCSVTGTVSVIYNAPPTISCAATSPDICPTTQGTLTASGASTYTWFPGGNIGSSIIVSPTVNTTYTVFGTSVTGCTNFCTVTQSVYAQPNTWSITASPSVICTTPASSTTLDILGAGTNYTWAVAPPIVAAPLVTNTPGTYLANVQNSVTGCIYQMSIAVSGTSLYAMLTSTTVCDQFSVNLAAMANFTPGNFTFNGVAVGNTLAPSPSGTYVLTYTYTGGILCDNTASTTITILNTPSPITLAVVVTPSASGQACNGSVISITAMPQPTNNGYTYTWQPSGFIGNPLTYTPNAPQGITVSCGPPQCPVTKSVNIDYTGVSCNCYTNCSASLAGNIVTDPPPNTVYCVIQDLFISGVITFSTSDFKMSPNTSIFVQPGSELTIEGSHLYACGDMWNGIVVQPGGTLNVIQAGPGFQPPLQKTSFIEDAKLAIDVQGYNLAPIPTNILFVDNAMFNKNLVSIHIAQYTKNQNVYPFTIQNSLFTSRTITFSPLNWPLTSAVKNSTNVIAPLQTPYIDPIYTPIPIINPSLSPSGFPTNGIMLDFVAFTTTNNVFRGISIGQNGPNNFNCFDNLNEDMTINNSNVTVINSVFQNGIRYGKGSSGGGKAINANSFPISIIQKSIPSNQIQIIDGTPNGAFNCRFYEKTAAADITGYLSTIIKYADVRSLANNYNQFNQVNTIGNRGFNIKTGRFIGITIQNSQIYNIKNGILITMDAGPFNSAKTVGFIDVDANLIAPYTTSPPPSGNYVNVGVSVGDLFPGFPYSAFPGIAPVVNVFNNTLRDVHNGADVKNINFCPVGINTNTVSMKNEPNTFSLNPTQRGINAAQNLKTAGINQNIVTGPPSWNPNMRDISSAMNGSLAVRCNTTATAERGIEFNGPQMIFQIEDNWMSNERFGFVLDNFAMLTATSTPSNVIGSAIRPTNNVWQHPWSYPGGFKTLTAGLSSAQNGMLYVTWQTGGGNLDPDGSGLSTLNNPGDNYFHTPFGSTITLLSATAAPIGCRLSNGGNGGGGGNGNALSTAMLENIAVSGFTFQSLQSEHNSANQHLGYRVLKANDSLTYGSPVLSTFSANAQVNSLQAMVDIEGSLSRGSLDSAQNQLSSLTPTSNVETNYKSFYQIYTNFADSSFTQNDSINLIILANLCPYTDGAVVFQARSLFNFIYDDFFKFDDNCGEGGDSRLMAHNTGDMQKTIKVILKSGIYPNPNDGNYVLKLEDSDQVSEKRSVEITIFDITGKVVLKELKWLDNNNETKLNQNLLKGTYQLKVKLPDGSTDVHRLIVQ